MKGHTYNMLFLCTENSARSILAECLLRELGKGRLQSFQRRQLPKGEADPLALELLRGQGFSTDVLCLKSWDKFAALGAPLMDFVFTVCDPAAR
jgi:protein-tyrosine-phosphatase